MQTQAYWQENGGISRLSLIAETDQDREDLKKAYAHYTQPNTGDSEIEAEQEQQEA